MSDLNIELTRQLERSRNADGSVDLPRLLGLVSATYEQQIALRQQTLRRRRLLGRNSADRYARVAARTRTARLQNHRFELALDCTNAAICVVDGKRRLVFCNTAFRLLFNRDPERAVPGTRLELVFDPRQHLSNAEPERRAAQADAYDELIEAGVSGQLMIDLANGATVRLTHEPAADGGFVLCFEDLTAHRVADLKIEQLSTHDELTGLPNRRVLHERLAERLRDREEGTQVAILCLDLDHFKPVNDTLGHPVGDTLMRAVTHRLRQAVRSSDFVARVGGDEFAVLIEGREDTFSVDPIAERIVSEVGRPYDIAGHRLVIGASIGIAIAPVDSTDAVELIRCADVALQAAKLRGGGRFCSFERQMDVAAKTRQALEEDLRRAIGTNEFDLHYQPLINVETRTVSGFEALLRWHSPTHGTVPPPIFISLAEELNLIDQLGAWVLHRACRDAASWPAGLKLAVNVSPKQFRGHDLLQTVRDALSRSGLAPERLELEITESVLMEQSTDTVMTLHRLRDLGVKIVMDDFGTGYSSLAYLSSFPFDKIKIDRTFINGLGRRSDAAAIVRAVTGLCRSLGIASTAEGVETSEQLAMLSGESCTEAQGYLFSKPRPVEELPSMLKEFARSGFQLAVA